MAIADERIIGILSRIKYPYNINALTSGRAMEGLADKDAHDTWVRQILEEREKMSGKLQTYGMVERVHPSDANFLLVKLKEPLKVQHFLMDRGIIVRDRSSVPLCEGCLRITVGTPAENLALYEALGAYAQTTQKEQP